MATGNPVKFVECTQEQYNSLETKDENTLYFVGDIEASSDNPFPVFGFIAKGSTIIARYNNLTIDNTVKSGGINPISSGGVFDSLKLQSDKLNSRINEWSGELALDNYITEIGAQTEVFSIGDNFSITSSGKSKSFAKGEGLFIAGAGGGFADAVVTLILSSGIYYLDKDSDLDNFDNYKVDVSGKQDKLTAGTGIKIENNIISATEQKQIATNENDITDTTEILIDEVETALLIDNKVSDSSNGLPTTRAVKNYVDSYEKTNYHEYSNNEQIVGRWIDGLPLYEKTVIVSSAKNPFNYDTNLRIADLNYITISKCTLHFLNTSYNEWFSSVCISQTINYRIFLDNESSDRATYIINKQGSFGNGVKDYICYITLQYTKVADRQGGSN